MGAKRENPGVGQEDLFGKIELTPEQRLAAERERLDAAAANAREPQLPDDRVSEAFTDAGYAAGPMTPGERMETRYRGRRMGGEEDPANPFPASGLSAAELAASNDGSGRDIYDEKLASLPTSHDQAVADSRERAGRERVLDAAVKRMNDTRPGFTSRVDSVEAARVAAERLRREARDRIDQAE